MKGRLKHFGLGKIGIATSMSHYPRRRSGRAILFIALLILAALAVLIGCAASVNGQTLRPVAFMPAIAVPLPTALDATGVITPTPEAR